MRRAVKADSLQKEELSTTELLVLNLKLLSPAVGDPMQVRMMKMMPIMFTVLFLFFPAGRVLYWLVNNVLGVAQQWYVIKQTERAQAAKA